MAEMSQGGSVVSPSVFAGLRLDSTNPVSIQEAIDQLDQYQNKVRINLFRLLHRLATQPGEALDEALGQLAAQPDKVIQESPEASILPHIATYREIVSRIKVLTAEISRKQAAEEVQKQVDEFEERLAAGGLSDAAYCCVQLGKTAADAEEELAEREARQQQQQQQQQAGGEGGAAAEAEEAGEEGGSEASPRVTAESVALLQETAERCGVKLREVLDACCEDVVVVESSGAGGGAPARGVVTVRSALLGGATRVPDLFAALQVLGLQEAYLRRITDRLVSGALQPMLAAAPCLVTVTNPPQPGGAATLTWSPALPGAAAPPPDGSCGGAASGSPCDAEHCCQRLLRLLASGLLEFDEGLMEVFGVPFWRAAADCYIEAVARPFITANAEDVDGCEAVAAAAADLEAFAESLSFASGEEPYLAPAVESLARHALSSRQEKYLEQARRLLVGDLPAQQLQQQPTQQGAAAAEGASSGGAAGTDPHSQLPHSHHTAEASAGGAAASGAGATAGGGASWETVTAGASLVLDQEYYSRLAAGELQDWELADPPCGLDPRGPLLPGTGCYQVTRRITAVVELVTGLLDDACAGSRAVCRSLRSAVSSIALLARTLPPLVYGSGGAGGGGSGESLGAVPQLGMLAANDLQHLANSLLLLSMAYGAALEAAGGEPAAPGLVEEALALRAAARSIMRDVLKHQCAAMDDLLAGLDRLRGVGASDAKVGMRYRRVVQQLLHSLGRLGRLASETLTPEDCVGAAAAVLNHVCGQLVAAVLAKGDMGHDECAELVALLEPLADGGVDTWLAAARAAGSGGSSSGGGSSGGAQLSGIPLEVVSAAATARCHQLRKLRCVLRVLGSDTLSAIASDWDRGYLTALAAPELEALLLAISEDSANRRALLAKLQAAV
ncbi:hypothetical protein HYH02_014912 [Chlamydomonas schloesseri]|uniref:Centromere/kinetochore protein zw10 homolog n=1 Tax=Chlamydomonas schloesseri TaxID=2026947 RepID=A0A835SLY2_9CHLO|nr:hypothetical protein HYH02_014912 [Chlamydomonas schloesseri]|eukprot:KAG2425913.1 hypothetical protein HYH02_014912 [Chlamydomonas schloesseri]